MLGLYSLGDMIQDRYLVRSILSGGMGIVYVCHDQETDEIFALKSVQDRMRLSLMGLERFLAEANVWILLDNHPNIVQARKIEVIRGQPYIFMEYVPGRRFPGSSLREWILHKDLDLQTTLKLAIGICRGMAYAQRVLPGLVHRDLKPENVLVADECIAKVTDFGLATAVMEDTNNSQLLPVEEWQEPFQTVMTRIGHAVGTPPYMSPEQCRGEPLDLRSDIYAIGCMLYEMLTFQWLADIHQPSEWLNWHVNKKPTAPSLVKRRVPRKLDHIVLRCLEKDSKCRYESFEDLLADLEGAYESLIGAPYEAEVPMGVSVDKRSRLEHALSLVQFGDLDKALKEIDAELLIAPDHAESWNIKGNILLQMGKADEALVCLEQALHLRPDFLPAQINRGLVYLLNRDSETAKAIFKDILTTIDSDAAVWINLGIAHATLNEVEQALRCYDKALGLDPYRREAWINKRDLLQELGRLDDASLCLEQALLYSVSFLHRATTAIQLSLSNPNVFRKDPYLYDMALRALKRLGPSLVAAAPAYHSGRKAPHWMNEAVGDNTAFIIFLASSLILVERFEADLGSGLPVADALEHYSADCMELLEPYRSSLLAMPNSTLIAAEMDKASWICELDLCNRLGNFGYHDVAFDRLTVIFRTVPDPRVLSPAYILSGISLFNLARYLDALQHLARGLQMDDISFMDLRIIAWMTAGECFGELGRTEEAVQAFTRVLQLAPGNPDAMQRITRYSRQ